MGDNSGPEEPPTKRSRTEAVANLKGATREEEEDEAEEDATSGEAEQDSVYALSYLCRSAFVLTDWVSTGSFPLQR